MPYKSAERNREYQRKWAGKRRPAKTAATQQANLIDIQSIRGFSPATKTLTWKQPTGANLKTIRSYPACVEKAREIINTRKVNRLLIATLCERACIIKKGGKPAANNLTLAKFARDIGVHERTLWCWVSTKRRVINHLSPDKDKIEWRAATLASEYLYAHPDTALTPDQLYERHTPGKATRDVAPIYAAIRHFHYYLNTFGVKGLTKEQQTKIRAYLSESLAIVEAAK